MDKITFIEQEQRGELVTYAIIAHEDGSFTSMLKSTYDEMIAAQRQTATI